VVLDATATDSRHEMNSYQHGASERPMTDLLDNPAVQAAGAPFVAGLIVTLALGRLRIGGLAVTAAFATAVALIAGFTLTPLTATRKIVLLTLAAAPVGLITDFVLRPARPRAIALAVAAALATLWVFWPILARQPAGQPFLLGGVAAALVAWLVGSSNGSLAARPVEGATSALALGAGAGALAILGASALFGQYGIAIAAGAGSVLLVMMARNRAIDTGSTLALPAALACGLLVSGAVILAQLQWYAAALLGLVPLAARLTLARRAPLWLRAVLHGLLAILPVVAACAVAYYGSRGA
jgi:hypothetical protein